MEIGVTTPVVIECGLTTVKLAQCIMEIGVTTPVVIECGLTTVKLAQCIMEIGVTTPMVIEYGLTTVKWWRSTGLGEKLSFARDRLMETFLWTVGVVFQTRFGYCRKMLTKVGTLLTTIDDVYDVYGTLDELELFTDAVERWDTNAMDQLPDYMKICFFALHNSINEMAFDTLKEQGFHSIRYLRKMWADLCKSYLLEATWYHIRYTPSFQEYIQNAWISISGPVLLGHAYFFVTNPVTKEALDCLEEYPNIIRWSSMILRLADDLGTSKDELDRGDVPKSIQCYMNETGATEEDAREYIRSLISTMWKKMNEEVGSASSPFSRTFIEIAMNLGRIAQCMYQYGDGYGVVDRETKKHILSLFIHPIPLHIGIDMKDVLETQP
ncbi:myrcene synthase, chloroplastic-like [Corylus avellana]|uniref:myrcene synthase, chloroplastic-like n=1 Tax=Corylus avellana TaxID=13451 RepID=UPI00286CED36|nr:myrcene synthase, chloroplastic-like [Corylus avellana]